MSGRQSDSYCLLGSGAPVNHPEQKGRGRSARPETHRQTEAPHTRSTTGNDFRISEPLFLINIT